MMSGTANPRQLVFVGALLIAGGLSFMFLAMGCGVAKGDEKPPVYLELVPASGDSECAIKADPDPVTIWTDKFKNTLKPKRVTWRVVRDQEGMYNWKIAGKTGDDTLGPVPDIECGKKKTKSGKSENYGDWDYSIEVWSCESRVMLCSYDPRVRIRD